MESADHVANNITKRHACLSPRTTPSEFVTLLTLWIGFGEFTVCGSLCVQCNVVKSADHEHYYCRSTYCACAEGRTSKQLD